MTPPDTHPMPSEERGQLVEWLDGTRAIAEKHPEALPFWLPADRLLETIDALLAALPPDTREEGLRAYVQHKASCAFLLGYGMDDDKPVPPFREACDCGLVAALASTPQPGLDATTLARALMISHHEQKWSVQPYGDVVPWSWEQIAAAVLAVAARQAGSEERTALEQRIDAQRVASAVLRQAGEEPK